MDKRIRLNDNWLFIRDKVLPDSLGTASGSLEDTSGSPWDMAGSAGQVTIPHTWNAADGQDGGNDYYRGTCSYRRILTTPQTKSGERVILEFEAIAMSAEIYVNGSRVGIHRGGFSAIYIDITEALNPAGEENELLVLADNGKNEEVYPQQADFTFYGGIYRDVWLHIVSEDHFAFTGIRVTPVFDSRTGSAHITVSGSQHIRKASRIRYHIRAPHIVGADAWSVIHESDHGMEEIFEKSLPVAEASVQAAEDTEACMEIPEPRLWNGREDPYLYILQCILEDENEEPLDVRYIRFGVRSFSLDPESGFLLNGKAFPLRGVSRHQDWGGLGNAIGPVQHRRDMDLILEIGANAVRLAHYQQAQYFYDLCDENGILAWAEIPYISLHMDPGRDNTISQMRELVTQCYNHASICVWGLSNEITAAGPVTENLLENHRLLNDLCHRLDPVRLTAIAHLSVLETDSPLVTLADASAYNLYYGWYVGECGQNDEFFDDWHKRWPDKPVGLTEYGADANIAYQSAAPVKGDYTEQYQAYYHEQVYKAVEEHPFVWCSFVWNLFDFAADGREEGGKKGCNQKGLVTFDRKIRKDAFYFYKACWSTEPFVHICGGRYVDRTEDVTHVKVYSNQNTVTLYVDDEALQTKTGSRIFEFEVPIRAEHVIRAEADGLRDEIRIRKVAEPNPDYICPDTGDIQNWFDVKEIDEAYYSIRDTFGELMKNPGTREIVEQMMGQMAASRGDLAKKAIRNPLMRKMLAGSTMESLIRQAGRIVTPEQARQANRMLQKVKKPAK